MFRFAFSLVGIFFSFQLPAIAQEVGVPKEIQFESHVEPILRKQCYACHGGADDFEGGLRLTSKKEALQRADSGEFAIVPGKPEASSLWQRIVSSGDDRMPPEGEPLSASDQRVVYQWLKEGAARPDDEDSGPVHWAYAMPQATVPPLDSSGWSRNAIDRFVLSRMKENGLSPSPEEDPSRLLRRLYLDLIGLPPTIDDVNRFVASPSDSAYEAEVERLLTSPRYGEKWARHWLDLARYSDSNGYQADQIREMWAFRDWVIDAMNADMPFDQFTIEQLAGDLLPNATISQRIATGFHRATTCNVEAGVDPEGNRTDQVIDRVNTTGTTWLATTVECAQCHNHKYDPISQEEYYQLFAFFNNTPIEVKQENKNSVQFNFYGPKMKLPLSKKGRDQISVLEAAKKAVETEIALLQKQTPKAASQLKELQQRMTRLKMEIAAASPTTLVMEEMKSRRETTLFVRGDFLSKGASVSADVPKALSDFPDNETRDRLGFARWLVSRENPLTARVAVNRWWYELFGTGIVETIEDFGTQGSLPSHPRLLDWMAVELQERDWSMKSMHRLIVTSSTYRQSSKVSVASKEADVKNRWLSRGPRNRLPAELIRDNALEISGVMVDAMGGPPIYPPQPPGLWHQTGRNEPVFKASESADRFRRGVYVVWRRAAPYPSFVSFDAPDRMTCVPRRPNTNTPLQALALLNDEVYVELAKTMAAKVLRATADRSQDSKLEYAFNLAVLRAPSARELELLRELLVSERAELEASPKRADELIAGLSMTKSKPPDDKLEWAAWFSVCNAILNLDEVISK